MVEDEASRALVESAHDALEAHVGGRAIRGSDHQQLRRALPLHLAMEGLGHLRVGQRHTVMFVVRLRLPAVDTERAGRLRAHGSAPPQLGSHPASILPYF